MLQRAHGRGKTPNDLRLFLGSRRAGAKVYAGASRNHWGVENNLHGQLDVTFGEDDCSIHNRNTAQGLVQAAG